MSKMKQMPYKIEAGAIERAKYRAKMAIREAAHPMERPSHSVMWRWVSAVAVVAVVVVGVIGLVKFYNENLHYNSPMEELIAEMQSAPDEVIYDWAADEIYYVDDANSL